MKKLFVLGTIAVLLSAVVLFPSTRSAPAVSGALPTPLRFVQPVSLGGAVAGRVDVSGTGGSPVFVSGGEVVGAAGSVPAGSTVSIQWRGVEVGRSAAAADGSFRATVPTLPDAQVSVVYGSGLPDLKPLADVALRGRTWVAGGKRVS